MIARLRRAAPALLLPLALLPSDRPSQMTEEIQTSLFVASGDDVRPFTCETTIAAPPARVWRAWTDGEAFAETYDPTRPELEARIDLAIGGRYEWLWDGKIGSNGCQVLCYVPERLLAFSWNSPPNQPVTRARRTWVVVELEPVAEAATQLRLTHLGFGEGAEWDETRAYFQAAWPTVLERFQAGLAGD